MSNIKTKKRTIYDTVLMNIETAKRNSILERLYTESKQTRQQFTTEVRDIARHTIEPNAAIARVIEFEKYLNRITVPFKCSGTGFANYNTDSEKEIVIDQVVFATNEKQAENLIIDEYAAKGYTVYDNDLSVIEMPAQISRKNLQSNQSTTQQYYLKLDIRQYPNLDSNNVIDCDEYLGLVKDIHFEAANDDEAVAYADKWWEENSYDLTYAYETECDVWRKSDNCIIYNPKTKNKSQRIYVKKVAL